MTRDCVVKILDGMKVADIQSVPVSREIVFLKRRKDQHWRDLLYLAGVAPEDMAKVLKVTVKLGEIVVEMETPSPVAPDLFGNVS